MGRTRAVQKPLSRLLVAAIAILLSATSVHGAASVAAPAGAMANAHASIGAAHFRQGTPTGRAADAGHGRAALPDASMAFGSPTDHPPSAGNDSRPYPIIAALLPMDWARQAESNLATRTIRGTPARAPPAR